VQYVSPDGQQVIRVERFAEYFNAPRDFESYISWLQTSNPNSQYIPAGQQEKLSGRDGIQFTYRTLERGAGQPANGSAPDSARRTTYADLIQVGASLWVLSVTAPTEQENTAKTDVFERIESKLTVLD
jgi:hypothetical protein